MSEKELNNYCDQLISEFKQKSLGGFAILISKEGVASVTIIPEWSVLTLDKDKKHVTLHRDEDDDFKTWLDKAEHTAYFLEALIKISGGAEKLCLRIQDALNEALEAAAKIAATVEAEKVTLH